MLLRALLSATLVLLAPLGAAGAGLPHCHDATCAGQVDGGQPGDASDSCAAPSPTVHPGQTFRGWLGYPVDPEDNYALQVSVAGAPLRVLLTEPPAAPALQVPHHRVEVWGPSGSLLCATHLGTASAEDSFRFTPATAGIHTLRVVPGPATPPVTLPDASCHLMCFVTNVTGYAVSILPG